MRAVVVSCSTTAIHGRGAGDGRGGGDKEEEKNR